MQRDYWYDVSRHPGPARQCPQHWRKGGRAHPAAAGCEQARRPSMRTDFVCAGTGARTDRQPHRGHRRCGAVSQGEFSARRGRRAGVSRISCNCANSLFCRRRWVPPTSMARAWPRVKTAWLADGIIQSYLLDSYAARKLGLQSTGHAGGVHNLTLESTGKRLRRMPGRHATRPYWLPS